MHLPVGLPRPGAGVFFGAYVSKLAGLMAAKVVLALFGSY